MIIPFRGLAQRGILKDPSPYDLSDDAWSGGSNVMFASGKAQRAAVFRGVVDPVSDPPAFVVGQPASSGFDRIVFAGATGKLYSYFSGAVTDVTPVGFTPAAVAGQFSSGFLGDVLYVNNPTAGIYYVGPAGGAFARDPHWDSTWSAAAFRVYKDYPIALNVTKGAQTNPSMVKTGSNTLAGLTTSSWDATDPTTNATENVLADLTGPLLDGCVMRDVFVLYSTEQVWEMVLSGDVFVFQYRRLFSEGGILATNCVCEVNGQHYVFGPYDIYTHNGFAKQSIVDKLNREWIFRHLDKKLAGRCFVQHDPAHHTILFAYVSSDDDAWFKSPATGCNKGYIFNYLDNTGGFVDLPNVTSMSLANLNSVLTWAAPASIKWNNTGGSWADQADSFGRTPVAVSGVMSGVISANRLLAWDMLDKGSVSFPYVSELNPPAYLERIGLDLDTENAGLAMWKMVNRVYPQVNIFRSVPVTIQIGSSQAPSGAVVWSQALTFNPATQYKVDVQRGGRYLAYRFSVAAPADFEVTGLDAEVMDNGSR